MARNMSIGGYTVTQRAGPRFTMDRALWISTDTSNAEAVFNPLQDFGAPLVDLTVDDFAEEGYFYQMGAPPLQVDILMGIPGIEFEEAWQRRIET